MRSIRRAAALLLGAVLAGAVFTPAPASAAYCSTTGINVVVDYGSLGGGVRTGCFNTGSRKTADAVFPAAGFPLEYVQNFPGAVCRVTGVPSSAGCVDMPPPDAYWGLFEAHGGGWIYSTSGVGGVRLDPGDSVAFVWQDGGTRDDPAVQPGPHSFATAKPSPSPTKTPTKTATASTSTKTSTKPRATAASAAPSTTAAPSASAAASARASATASASASAATPAAPATTTDASPGAGPTSAAAAGPLESRPVAHRDSGGLPWFVPAGVLVLLAGGAGGATWWRRRTTG